MTQARTGVYLMKRVYCETQHLSLLVHPPTDTRRSPPPPQPLCAVWGIMPVHPGDACSGIVQQMKERSKVRKVAFCALSLVLAFAVAGQAEELDEVLANYYEAIGGLEAWEAVESMRVTGSMGMGQGMEMPFTMVLKRPGMIRQEFTVQGMQGIMAGDGETYWMHMPFMGRTDPEPMPDDQVKQISRQADIEGPLMNAEEKGITLELVGKEDLEGTEVYHITVTREDGDVEHHFLDAEYYVPIQVKTKTEMQGQEMEMTMVFGDYKEINGLMMAHSIQIVGGAGGALTMNSIEVDVEVDDSIFAMPEVAEPEAEATGTDG